MLDLDDIVQKIEEHRTKYLRLVQLANSLLQTILYIQQLALELQSSSEDLLVELRTPSPETKSPVPASIPTKLLLKSPEIFSREEIEEDLRQRALSPAESPAKQPTHPRYQFSKSLAPENTEEPVSPVWQKSGQLVKHSNQLSKSPSPEDTEQNLCFEWQKADPSPAAGKRRKFSGYHFSKSPTPEDNEQIVSPVQHKSDRFHPRPKHSKRRSNSPTPEGTEQILCFERQKTAPSPAAVKQTTYFGYNFSKSPTPEDTEQIVSPVRLGLPYCSHMKRVHSRILIKEYKRVQ